MIGRLGIVQGNMSGKENDKASIIITNKEVGSFNPFKVRKDSEFKGNERLDKSPDQEKEDEYPGVSSQKQVRLRAEQLFKEGAA
eukprot:15634325-Heterocapsa_arctica.AAC.1